MMRGLITISMTRDEFYALLFHIGIPFNHEIVKGTNAFTHYLQRVRDKALAEGLDDDAIGDAHMQFLELVKQTAKQEGIDIWGA